MVRSHPYPRYILIHNSCNRWSLTQGSFWLGNSFSLPFFGALPYVGKLFHWDQETEAKTELVIMLTPEIMAGKAVDEKYLSESSSIKNFGYDDATTNMVNPSFKR